MGRDEVESLLDGSLKGWDLEPYGLPIRGGGREIIGEVYGFLIPLFSLRFDYLIFAFIMMRSDIFSAFVGCC